MNELRIILISKLTEKNIKYYRWGFFFGYCLYLTTNYLVCKMLLKSKFTWFV